MISGQYESAEMPQSSHIGAFCLLIILYPREGDAGSSVLLGSLPVSLRPRISSHGKGRGLSGSLTEAIASETTARAIFDLSGYPGDKREEHEHQLLTHFQGSRASLKELATKAMEILDRISKNWVLEGAKTIQNGEVRLRKLSKELTERIEQLIVYGSKYGQHVLQCMNKTIFEMELNKILQETSRCYSDSLLSVQTELKKIEDEEKVALEGIEEHGKNIFDMLSTCFFKDNTTGVIECLQKVDGMHMGNRIRDVEATKLTLEMARIVNEIPRKFSECTMQGLAQTEAHLRKGYAQSLTCLKENIT